MDDQKVELQITSAQELKENEAILILSSVLEYAIARDTKQFVDFMIEVKGSLKKYYGKDIGIIRMKTICPEDNYKEYLDRR